MEYDKIFAQIQTDSRTIQLTDNENIIFNKLYEQKKVLKSDLLNCVSAKRFKLFSENSIRVTIARINRKIKGIGEIQSIHKIGYELTIF